jgi:hypothetical protein
MHFSRHHLRYVVVRIQEPNHIHKLRARDSLPDGTWVDEYTVVVMHEADRSSKPPCPKAVTFFFDVYRKH